jgi:spermidine/putrescine-binding protein
VLRAGTRETTKGIILVVQQDGSTLTVKQETLASNGDHIKQTSVRNIDGSETRELTLANRERIAVWTAVSDSLVGTIKEATADGEIAYTSVWKLNEGGKQLVVSMRRPDGETRLVYLRK